MPESGELRSGEEDHQARSVSRNPSLRVANAGGDEDSERRPMSRSSSLGRGVHDNGRYLCTAEEQMAESGVMALAHSAAVSHNSSARGANQGAVAPAHHVAGSPLEPEQVSQQDQTREDDGRVVFDC